MTAETGLKTIAKTALTDPELRDIYRRLYYLRRFDERMAQLYQQRKIRGFCHLSIGQEAVALAVDYAFSREDYAITSYRDHALALARGVDPYRMVCEMAMKADGCSRAKGGSMHLFDVERNFYGGHGIVGGQIPLATGLAFASRYRNEERVVLCLFGESAVNQGVFHESLNMASLWQLPIVYLCENNRYGLGTSMERSSAVTDLCTRVEPAYGIVSESVDGLDFFALTEALNQAANTARYDRQPRFLEARTYRLRNHAPNHHSGPTNAGQVEDHRKQDAITRLELFLMEYKGWDSAAFGALRDEVKEEIDGVIVRALESQAPEIGSLYEDVIE